MKKVFVLMFCTLFYVRTHSNPLQYEVILHFDPYTTKGKYGKEMMLHYDHIASEGWVAHGPGSVNDHLTLMESWQFTISDYATNKTQAHWSEAQLYKVQDKLKEIGIESYVEWKYIRPGYWTGAIYFDDYKIYKLTNISNHFAERDINKYNPFNQ